MLAFLCLHILCLKKYKPAVRRVTFSRAVDWIKIKLAIAHFTLYDMQYHILLPIISPPAFMGFSPFKRVYLFCRYWRYLLTRAV